MRYERLVCTMFVIAAALEAPIPALAIETQGEVGGVAFTYYAPGWTWQDRDVNILAVFENKSTREAAVTLTLGLPQENEHTFSYGGPDEIQLRIAPGAVERRAFTNIAAAKGAPLGHYAFTLTASSADETIQVQFDVRTIRGAVVSPGKWAIWIPVGLSLGWGVVMALAMFRMAGAGAWLRPGRPIAEAEEANE